MNRDLFRRMLQRPLYPAAAFSLLLHLLLALVSGTGGQQYAKLQDPPRKIPLARINLQAIDPGQTAAPQVQVFKDDLFQDTTDEEKKLFKLRKAEDPRRKVAIQYDKGLRDLLTPGRMTGSGDTNSYVPFYSLDTLPRPKTPYETRITVPEQATALGISLFAVVVELLIDEKGKLLSSRIVTDGAYGFGEAVRRGLEGISFYPGKVRGRAVRTLLRERFLFSGGGQ